MIYIPSGLADGMGLLREKVQQASQELLTGVEHESAAKVGRHSLND